MLSGSVTNRYADALFELARDKGQLDGVAADVESLSAQVADPAVAGFLFDARVQNSEKRARIDELRAQLQPTTFNFVRLLLDKNRLEVLRDLGPAFRKRRLADQGVVEGLLECARPLDDASREQLEASLSRKLSRTVKLESKLVAELIGGVRVTVDHRMLDQSLRGRLDGLRSNLENAPVSLDAPGDAPG